MRISIAQMKIAAGNIHKNLQKGIDLIKQAKSEKCDIILFPEVWTTGFLFNKLKELSKETPETLDKLKAVSNGICICGSYVVDDKNSDKVFNVFYAIKDGEIIFKYKKVMLFSFTHEDKYFISGNFQQKNTFEINGVTIGVSICYELRFPEFFRKSALNGALIHLHSAIWPMPRIKHWDLLSKARAVENQFFLITANGTGRSDKWQLGGHSAIIDPTGEPMIFSEKDEGLLSSEIDINYLNRIRQQFPAFEDSKFFKNIYP